MRDILPEEFSEWWQSPVTEALMETLNLEYEVLVHGLATGAYINDPKERMFMGYVNAIRNMMDKDNLRESIVVDEEESE